MKEGAAQDVPALTGLRGVGAIIVVIYHYLEAPAAPGARAPFAGYLAVDLFFVLSGFLMAMNYGKDFSGRFSVSAFCGFLAKRFARVYPLYALTTATVFALSFINLFPSRVRLQVLAANLTLTQQLGPGLIRSELGNSILGGAWSISTEFGAYLLFPLLFALACRRSARVAFAVLGLCTIVLTGLVIMPETFKPQQLPPQGPLDIWSGWSLLPLVRCLAEFTIGLLAARYAESGSTRWIGSAVGGYLSLAVFGLSLFVRNDDFLTVVAVAALVTHLGAGKSKVGAVLGSKAFLWLGEVSYAVYLFHLAAITLTYERPVGIFRQHWFHSDYPLVFAFTFLVLLIASRLAFLYLEKPSRRLVRQMIGARAGRPIATEVAAP